MLLVLAFVFTNCDKEQTEPIQTGAVDFTFTANYDGAPLVISEEVYEYNGKPIRFNKINFYLSDITIGETALNDIILIDITKTHLDTQSSRSGTNLEFSKVPVGIYNSVAFGVGVSPDLNRTKPEEYATNHPLGADNIEGYREDWDSYIFVNIEGQYDVDGDGFGPEDISFAYHVGQDDMYKQLPMDFNSPITLTPEELFTINFKLDIKKLFLQPDGQLFPLSTRDTSNQIDTMQMIMDNFNQALDYTF